MIRKKDVNDAFVKQKLAEYNSIVDDLTNQVLPFLEHISYESLTNGRSKTEISRELNFMEKLKEPTYQKMVKYRDGSDVEVPRYVKEEAKRNVEKVNKAINERLAEVKPSPYTGTLSTVKAEGLVPTSLGSGRTKRDVEKRINTLRKRARPSYMREKDELFKQNYKSMLYNHIPTYASELSSLVEMIDGRTLYMATISPRYAGALALEYIYAPTEQKEKYLNVKSTLLELIDNE